MHLDAWVDDVNRRALDVDRLFGAQCWDLWSDYAQRVVGVPFARTVTRAGGAGPHGGWACNVLHNAAAAGLGRYFQQLPAGTTGRAGDVAFWERSKRWPGSHVAIVLADLGDRLLCLSQNPGPPQKLLLPKDALLGYLRPRSKAAAPRPADPTPTKGLLMALSDYDQELVKNATVDINNRTADMAAAQQTMATALQTMAAQLQTMHALYAARDGRGWTFRDIVESHVKAILADQRGGARVDVAAFADELSRRLAD